MKPTATARLRLRRRHSRTTVLRTICFASLATMSVSLQNAGADEPQVGGDGAMDVVAMTFNIRFNNPDDGPNAWPRRRDDVAKLILRERPDLAGMQEALADQVADLKERMKDYDAFGVGRDDGKEQGEFSPVFFRRDRFDVLDKGTFWLSATPDKVGSKGWDAALPRVATWLRVRDKASSQEFLAANVHFDHSGERARVESARLLRRKLAQIAGELPILLLGDFNAAPDSPPYKAVLESEPVDGKTPPSGDAAQRPAAVFRDARDLIDKPLGPNTTWNGFRRAVDNNRIDHVFVDRHWTVTDYRVVDEKTPDNRFYSDHFPIVAKLRLAR